MKFVKFAAASLTLPGFSPAFADICEVFFSDDCNSPAEITGQEAEPADLTMVIPAVTSTLRDVRHPAD